MFEVTINRKRKICAKNSRGPLPHIKHVYSFNQSYRCNSAGVQRRNLIPRPRILTYLRMASGNSLLVAAIDFGTTYSGYAFSLKHDYKTDPLKIHANQAWNAGGRQLLSLKTPTCLLLNNDQELDSFGYVAENRYADIVIDGKQNEYYYFHRFKMNLHNNKDISDDLMLEDVTGKPVSALKIFSTAIKALKNHLLDHLNSKGTGVTMNEIFWVLTVPAIWSDKAKQFMRKSAEEAGIEKTDLLIGLEPEVASVFCQYLPTEKLLGSQPEFEMSGEGTKYMVVDIGGGTVDIIVHEKLPNGKLKELTRATGNDCGGTSVDGRYFQLLVKIFGGPLMKNLQNEYPDAYLDLFREFETVKRTVDSTKTGKVNITLPYVPIDKLCRNHLSEELSEVVASSGCSNNVSVRSDKLRIDAETVRGLFKPTIDGIIDCISDVLRRNETEGVSHLLVVGGFANCLLVEEAIRENFSEIRLIIPEESSLVVLKGAVLFGRNPKCVRSRIMKYTYGVDSVRGFDDQDHDKKYLFINDNVRQCSSIFNTLVSKGESVETGKKVTKEFYSIYENQTSMKFPIFVTPNCSAKYTDEDGCECIGCSVLKFSNPQKEKRWVDVDFTFGDTELGITAVDRLSKDKIEVSLRLY